MLPSSIVCDLWGLGLRTVHGEGRGLAAWGFGGIVCRHQRKPLQPGHQITHLGGPNMGFFDKRKLPSGVARILFLELRDAPGAVPTRGQLVSMAMLTPLSELQRPSGITWCSHPRGIWRAPGGSQDFSRAKRAVCRHPPKPHGPPGPAGRCLRTWSTVTTLCSQS